MKRLRWQLLIVVLALIAIGVLLLAQRPTALPGIEPVLQPTKGGVYTEGLIGSLSRLNPALDYYNSVDQDVNRLIYSSLIRFDSRGLPYGDLANRWGISRDGKIYSISIRPDAVWHDGEPVTSKDVAFTTSLFSSEAIPLPEDLREFWKEIEVVEQDEHTLQFNLPESFAPFMDYLTFGILPEHIWGKLTPQEMVNSKLNLQPVGSGPYQFSKLNVENEQITGVELKLFEDYFGDKPFIEQVKFRYYPDALTAFSAYRAGDVQGLSEITPEVLTDALKEPELSVYTGRLFRTGLVLLNLNNPSAPFFQDANIRKALLMGINRQWIIDRILGGQAVLAHSPIFPESWAYYDGVEQVPFDTQAAEKILKEAGYTYPAEGGTVREKEGTPLSFEFLYPELEPYPSIAQAIAKDWEKLGVRAELQPVPYDELAEGRLETRNYEAALVELNFSHSPDPDPYPFWHQAQAATGQNYSRWDDRQASEYLEQGRVIVDLPDRTRRYRNFQVRFAQEVPALLLYYPVYSYGVDAEVQGISIGPIGVPADRFNNIARWFLVTKTAANITPTPTP